MDDLLKKLEIKIQNTLKEVAQLKQDHAKAIQKNALFGHKNQMAISHIENMLFQLKSLESETHD